MDYKKLVNAAGYKGDKAAYIARKLESRNIPKDKLNQLGSYFPKADNLAGVSLNELGNALYGVANAPEPEKPKAIKKAADNTAVKDGD